MGQLKASVIVPMYNSAGSLGRCVESLQSQTCDSLEIVLVNDGSTDDTLGIAQSFAAQDQRIMLIDQPNSGVSAARNAGINAARGSVLFFVDADDYIDFDTVEHVFDAMTTACAEVVVFGAVCEPEEQASKRVRELTSPASGVFDVPSPELLFHANAQPYACRVAFSRAFVERNHLRFPAGLALGEDAVFLLDAYALSRKTVLLSEKHYHYVMDEASATHGFNDGGARAKKLDAHMTMLEDVLGDWSRYHLLDLCPGELVAWFLDLIVFDLARLVESDFSPVANRIDDAFKASIGPTWPSLPGKRAIRSVARKIQGSEPVSLLDAMAFYIASRGVKACVERFL